MCGGVSSACILCTTCVQHPQRAEKDVGSFGTRITDGCEALYCCWELNPSPLQEQMPSTNDNDISPAAS